MRAQLMLLDQPRKASDAEVFAAGLQAAGYSVHKRIGGPTKADVVVCWNRQGREHVEAKRFEAAGARVLVAENGYLGNPWRGARWFALSLSHHNGRGEWRPAGPERWDGWQVELQPMRSPHQARPLILAQRGIGEPALKAPDRWLDETVRLTRGRVRRHPGISHAGPTLEDDLRGVDTVVTWSSGAAIKAMVAGCWCWHGMPRWVAADCSMPLAAWGKVEQPAEDERLPMFQRLAWAMWTAAEVATGEPIRRLTC